MRQAFDSRRSPLLPMIVTVVAFAVGWWQKLPCYATGWRRHSEVRFSEFCYSDVPILFRQRGLIAGIFPYAPGGWRHPLEYPVVTGLVMDVTARLTRWLVPGAGRMAMTRAYFNVNTVLLLACALAVVWMTWAALRRAGAPPALVLLVAAAPSLALSGTINWDLVVVACAMGALLAWEYRRPTLTGALIGLGVAAKLYPALLLGPLFVVCLRQRRIAEFARVTGAAVVAWAAVNAPVAVRYPDGWMEFWRFNAERRADYGSIWHAMVLTGHRPPADLNDVATALLGLLLAGVAALAWWAPRPPDQAQLALLTVAAFLVTNKVYSPQYVLWLLPLVVLATARLPVWRVVTLWAVWQAGEVVYWFAIWRYFTKLPEHDAWQYPAAIVLRVVVTLVVCGVVTWEAVRRTPAAPYEEAVPLREPSPRWYPLRTWLAQTPVGPRS